MISLSKEQIKSYFDDAYEYARMFSTCIKVNVGSLFLDSNMKTYHGANCNYDPNNEQGQCLVTGECYKAKVSGIYESTEETRHLCKAQHAEDMLLSWMNSVKKKFDRDNGILFVTRYPCLNCAKLIVESKIKNVYYAGRQEISEEVAKLFNDNNVHYEWFSEFDYEGDSVKDYEWWTDTLAKHAYDIVKDRKFPVTIPAYNRPSAPTLRNLGLINMTEDKNWEFILITRESQREMYLEATKQYKYVTIKSFPDEIINNAGAVRRETMKWLNSEGILGTFQMDDDVSMISYSHAGRKGDGYPKSAYVTGTNICDVLAMWQIASEKAFSIDNSLITCGQQVAFSWKVEYCRSNESYCRMCGPMTQVVCFNVKRLNELQLFHNNNADVGFDDIDFTLRVIESGNQTTCFPWLVYGCEALGGGEGNIVPKDILQARFTKNQNTLKSLHQTKPYVNFRVKRDLDQVCINWANSRKYYAEKHGLDKNSDFMMYPKFNIWNNGRLLEEAKEMKYER